MTTESDLFNTIKGLVANRAYPDLAPMNTPRPFIVYSQVGGEAIAFLNSSLPDKKHGRFQIDVYADSRAACALVALQVETAMTTTAFFNARAMSAPTSTYEPDVLMFGSQQDFSIWSIR